MYTLLSNIIKPVVDLLRHVDLIFGGPRDLIHKLPLCYFLRFSVDLRCPSHLLMFFHHVELHLKGDLHQALLLFFLLIFKELMSVPILTDSWYYSGCAL
jgi:hypothetical protein